MQTLYDLIYEFWWYWYSPSLMSEGMTTATNWLVWVLTSLLLVSVFVLPFVFACRKVRRRRK